MKILVTGGCGFIGSAFLLKYVPVHPEIQFVNLDKLTYAGNPANLTSIQDLSNYSFEKLDLADGSAVKEAVRRIGPTRVVHFAAESHVDRSIDSPSDFIQSNIMGTFHLLDACRGCWANGEGRFLAVSTDEVYGSLGAEGLFTESSPYQPSSPYAASKASADHLVRAYHTTYGFPALVSNCSNNYGPRQFPEKLIPLMILNACEGKPLPIYGSGENVRDWLYVEDHCEALWTILESGGVGQTYNVGGNCERSNLQVVRSICEAVAAKLERQADELWGLVQHVTDRPGHDFRYAIDSSKLKNELGWSPSRTFEQGMAETVDWYLANQAWVESVKSGAYKDWYQKNYGDLQ